MLTKVKFFSEYQDQEIEAEVLEERKHTLKLKLPDGNVIVKKKRQIKLLSAGAWKNEPELVEFLEEMREIK